MSTRTPELRAEIAQHFATSNNATPRHLREKAL